MRAISAADSVSLAIQRTREFLFRPFNWGTYLKLGLVAIITEGLGATSVPRRTAVIRRDMDQSIHSPFHIPPEWIAAIVAAVLVAIVLSLVVFYLVTRLRFAFFHCLIHNTKEIRPGWRLYREPGDALLLAECGGGILLSAAGGAGRASLRGRASGGCFTRFSRAASPIWGCCSLSFCP